MNDETYTKKITRELVSGAQHPEKLWRVLENGNSIGAYCDEVFHGNDHRTRFVGQWSAIKTVLEQRDNSDCYLKEATAKQKAVRAAINKQLDKRARDRKNAAGSQLIIDTLSKGEKS